MIIESRHREKLQRSRQDLVQQLTELNARHIRSQSQLAGFEIEITRCHEAIERGDQSEEFVDEVIRHEKMINEINTERTAIDKARDALHGELQELDHEIQECISTNKST